MALNNIQGSTNNTISNVNTTQPASTVDQQQLNQLLQQVLQLLLQLLPETRDSLASNQVSQIQGDEIPSTIANAASTASAVEIPEAQFDEIPPTVTTITSATGETQTIVSDPTISTRANLVSQTEANVAEEGEVEASTSARVINPTIAQQTTEADLLGAVAANTDDPAALVVANAES